MRTRRSGCKKAGFACSFRDREVWLEPGEFMVVPKGVEHRPMAPEEAWIVMLEPAGTLNTGDVVSDRTKHDPEWV